LLALVQLKTVIDGCEELFVNGLHEIVLQDEQALKIKVGAFDMQGELLDRHESFVGPVHKASVVKQPFKSVGNVVFGR
jgi:hypothetical protein